jgi:hypothetical protein
MAEKADAQAQEAWKRGAMGSPIPFAIRNLLNGRGVGGGGGAPGPGGGGRGPTKYHRLAFRNSLHQANPFPPSKAASPSEGRFALSFDLPLKEAGSLCKFAACNGCA